MEVGKLILSIIHHTGLIIFCAKTMIHADEITPESCTKLCNVPSSWLPVSRNVCYGSTGDQFGNFTINKHCRLVAMRLTHISGYLSGYKTVSRAKSRWGLKPVRYPYLFSTVILKDGKLWYPNELASDGSYRKPNGFEGMDDLFFFRKSANLIAGEKLQIAFGPDFINYRESYNEGTHCVDIDISCLE